jgi:hypothetical protein
MNGGSMFSVAVPTLWKYPPFLQILQDLDRCEYIDEILIFDNNPTQTPTLPPSKTHKTTFLRDALLRNIFVNPAWNVLVEKAKNERICLLNDDLLIDVKVFHRVNEFMDANPNCGVIGFAAGDHEALTGQKKTTSGTIEIIPHTTQHMWSFGEMMFIRKSTWVHIPDEMKLFCGDNFIYETHKLAGRTNYLITNSIWNTPHSVSSRSFVNEHEASDRAAYTKHFELLRKSYE